ncbi:selenium cofactor biosynthesis protein YqeC [Paramaledivibacter caminithermalis]|jgi:probable selenium-dependent hydroxylase accessory protein YqeC|uniref:Probable selenium-dependent hydroxylase accessory protein YqeC n=1 Tax=Paramaledivibacter caminithermalis (strain DSM 15212 / CIP 107654 / DViRD3) TaxID=1121301 RepID=A0A1M6K940_PARC5|nr:selenium cofactor biosynthesis protein YqeC [Paramaledivibacter caminithermalis]SHJ55387.1 probable selenium-dependent hydroxylase accessory protein YqeC [Paramaledivibacter caminithermalis DSM 15212]
MQFFEQKIKNIYEGLDINLEKKENICFIGAGGKTTAMFRLARELKSLGKKVLVTTSTAIYYPSEKYIDRVLVANNISKINDLKSQRGLMIVIGKDISWEGKLLGLDKCFIDKICSKNIFDYILIEGDGGKCRPIKAPGNHEPVIPFITSITVGVVGLDSIGRFIEDRYVHRPKIFEEITGSLPYEIVTEEKIVKLITSDIGLFKNTPKNSKKYLLLNKAEDEERKKSAYIIRDLIRKKGFKIDGIIISSLLNNDIFRN